MGRGRVLGTGAASLLFLSSLVVLSRRPNSGEEELPVPLAPLPTSSDPGTYGSCNTYVAN